jgi:hypothetical protein
VKRRDFITLLGSAVSAWPLAARAQPTTERVRRIGVLMNTTADDPEGQARIAAHEQRRQLSADNRSRRGNPRIGSSSRRVIRRSKAPSKTAANKQTG